MKLLTILGIGTLSFALGCQSTAPTAAKTSENSPEKNEKPVAAAPVVKKAERISLADAKKDFDAGIAVFVDTRSNNFYVNEHVKGALNVPMSDFDNTYKSVPKDKKIIAYCS